MTQSQEIIPAILRLLKATPSHPWGKEVGNPTADIQPVRKSSWLCLQNTSRIRSLTPPPPLPLWVKELRTAIWLFSSFLISQSACFSPPPPPGPVLNTVIAALNLLKPKSNKFRLWRKASAGSSLTPNLPFQHCSHLRGVPAQISTWLIPFTFTCPFSRESHPGRT